MIYHGHFANYDSLPYGDNLPPEERIIYACYDQGDYDGAALIVYLDEEGRIMANYDSHCSCYGLENWSPEETDYDTLLMQHSTWEGLEEAVKAHRTIKWLVDEEDE
jgi:hypothetical protein